MFFYIFLKLISNTNDIKKSIFINKKRRYNGNMICPKCGSPHDKVLESRSTKEEEKARKKAEAEAAKKEPPLDGGECVLTADTVLQVMNT